MSNSIFPINIHISFYLIFALLFGYRATSYSQDPCADADRNLITYFGTNISDNASTINRIGDYGYIVGGYRLIGGVQRMVITRLDLCGEIVWDHAYNTSQMGICTGIELIDDVIHISGYKDWKTLLLKLNLDGTVISAKTFGTVSTYPRNTVISNDNNFLTVGVSSASGGLGAADNYLVKSSFDGTTLWSKRFGRGADDFGHNLMEDVDGDVITIGYTRGYEGGTRKGFVSKFDESGNLLWNKEYAVGTGQTYFNYCTIIDGFYYFSGQSNFATSGSDDILIIKTDPDGNLIWSKFLGTSGLDQGLSITEKDGELIGYAKAWSPTKDQEMVIYRMDTDGNFLDYASFGTSSKDEIAFNASHNFRQEEDGMYGFFLPNTGVIGSQENAFFRFSSIDSICDPSDVVLAVLSPTVIVTTVPLTVLSPSWNASTVTYPIGAITHESGIICAEFPEPDTCEVITNFEFIAAGVSSTDGATGDCFLNSIAFNDLSTVEGDTISEWLWDFGDGGTSTEQNPDHTFSEAGTYTISLLVTTSEGCSDEFTMEIIMTDFVEYEYVIEEPTCFGLSDGTITINVEGEIEDLIFTITNEGGETLNVDNSNVAEGLDTGWYFLNVSDGSPCNLTDSIFLDQPDFLTPEYIFNEPTCYGFSDGSITINVVGVFDTLIFTITNTDGEVLNIGNSNTANGLGSGWYFMNVNDGTPCSKSDSVFIDQPGILDALIATQDALCYGDENGLAWVTEVINYEGSFDAISYYWAPNPAGIEGLGADSTWALGDGTYVLTINDENGCSATIDFTINQPDSLFLVEFGSEPASCRLYGYQNGNGVVYGAAAGGTPDYDYSWINLETGAEINNTTWGGLNPGNYEFHVVDNNGCSLMASIFLDSLNPIAAFTIISDQLNADYKGTANVEAFFENNSLNFSNDGDPFADTTFFWNLNTPEGNWIITHDYFEIVDTVYGPRSQSYEVEVCLVAMNKNGCTDTACKIITIFSPYEFEPVNIFSPNGDGINDIFTFQYLSSSIKTFNCVIVDRWGVVMITLDDINAGWNGINKNGNVCTDGTYFYVYEATSDDGNNYRGQGTVQLVGH